MTTPVSIERRILLIHGQKVLLDNAALAELYGVETKVLLQAVKRNIDRFSEGFMFVLTKQEFNHLRSQIVTSSGGGRRTPPYAFMEQGVAMLSNVLRSKQAVQVNIEIMRIFVKLRRMIGENTEIQAKLNQFEERYGEQFRVVFDAIRELMKQNKVGSKPIGFIWGEG